MGHWYRDFLADLRSLVEAGVPILDALASIEYGQKGARALLAARLRQEMKKGATLSEALARDPGRVPREHAALIEAGERSGNLGLALERLVADLDRRWVLLKQAFSQVAYPFLVLLAAAVLLPTPLLLTQGPGAYVLVEASIFGPLLAIVLGVWGARRRLTPGSPARERLERTVLALPWFGSILGERATGRSLWLLGRLLEAGLPFAEALPLAAGAQTLDSVRAELLRVKGGLEGRRSVSEAVLELRVLREAPEAEARIRAGEKAGTLDHAFRDLGSHLEERAHGRLVRSLYILAVVLILGVGAVVLIRGLAVMSGLNSGIDEI